MERLIKNILGFTFALLVLSVVWVSNAAEKMVRPSTRLLTSNDDTIKKDSIKLRFPFKDQTDTLSGRRSKSPLFLKDPANITEELEYDPIAKEYTIRRKIGDYEFRRPVVLDFKDYQKYDTERALRNYWFERSQTAGQTDNLRTVPQMTIGGDVFERVFGSNVIDIRPQGAAELSFGILSNRNNNPALSIRNRRTTNFDFKEKIQMSVAAKIGDKIEFNTNYNTESTFEFENKLKLKYEGKEDEIIKLIEAGDVSLPLNGTLITGNQSLFGLKTQMQFGKTTVTTVFSQQKSKTSNITVQGGAQTTKFRLAALDYEENRHFFISQYFRDHYDEALKTLPIITSNVNISKIEVWVTNIGPAVNENRNIVAFADLAERIPYNKNIHGNNLYNYPDNNANDLVSGLDINTVRNINGVSDYLTGTKRMTGGLDFEKVELARKLNPTEYSFNSKLGFISLNTTLSSNQVLAVAFQYTQLGDNKIYKVGEFSDENIGSSNCLVVKLLKSTALNSHIPMWNLMMKNVYNIGAYRINKQDFIFNILYAGNNNGVPTSYLSEGSSSIKGVPLLKVLNLDNLDVQYNPNPDGQFDFIDSAYYAGGTIQSSNGRIFFTVKEPFGNYLRSKLADPVLADKLCYDSLYTLPKSGAMQYPDKNKFILDGQYKSATGSEINLNAYNVPQGSVKVTAGGIPLAENIDYTVDYTLGRVRIINEGILNSGTPINISMENNAMFNVQTQTLLGARIDHRVNKDFNIGATIMNLSEKPLTPKTNFGNEPISNTIWGADFNYQHESRFLTRLVDKLPFISTKAPSKITMSGEFAQFLPGHSRTVGKAGTSYIDDFEGSKSTVDLKNPASWFLASTPQGQVQPDMFPEAAPGTGLRYGFNRALLSWYIIDPLFYDRRSSIRPRNIDRDELSRNSVRAVSEQEVFPNTDPPNNQPVNLPILNMAYYPSERGPYNFDVEGVAGLSAGIGSDGKLRYPETRWGGIMRKVETSDFDAANVEYIEFWMMDPFSENPNHKGGQIYLNLGDVSEDLLRDGRKGFENGLPATQDVINVDTTIWGRVPKIQALVQTFDNNVTARKYQDVGYDGLSDTDERTFFKGTYLDKISRLFGTTSEAYLSAEKDPANDDYHYFRGSDYDNDPNFGTISARYKRYTGAEANSPASEQSNELYSTQATNYPNTEDIDHDNTLNETERYFQYKIDLQPNHMNVGENYIADKRVASGIPLENGKVGEVTWYQFKIPIHSPDKVVGNIQDFRSIRFIRMFMKNFHEEVVCRFATFELVRGEWRAYDKSLLVNNAPLPTPDPTGFELSTVSFEENGNRQPIPYVIPPGIDREINYGTTNLQRLNEQAMVMRVKNLADGDARGSYKTTDFDFRRYKKLKMYVHGEKILANKELQKGDLTLFIRMGSDFTGNYYEYEMPITFTPWNVSNSDPYVIWPTANNIEITFEDLVNTKLLRNDMISRRTPGVSMISPFTVSSGDNKITVVGTPSVSDVKAFMIGIRNPRKILVNDKDDGDVKSAEIWVNELRLTDFNEKQAWAATGRISANLADLGDVTISGMHSTPGFGSIEKKVNERQLEAVTQFDFATNVELGKFLPEKSGIHVPLHFDYSESKNTPEFNPLDPDVDFQKQLSRLNKSQQDSLKNKTEDLTIRRNFNLINVHKERLTNANRSTKIYDPENFDFTYAYSEITHRNIDIDYDIQKTYRGGLGYNYTGNPKNFRPFENLGLISSVKALQAIKDFNFYLFPRAFSFRSDMNREYDVRLMRNKSDALVTIDPVYYKKWNWTRTYGLFWDLSQSLKVDFQANADAYINEPLGEINRNSDDFQRKRDSIKDEILRFGTLTNYVQTANVNYTLPFSKIWILDWINSTARYTGQFRWEASPKSLQPRLGNTIDNAAQKQLNATLRFSTLFNKWGLLRRVLAVEPGFGADNKQSKQPSNTKSGLSWNDLSIPAKTAVMLAKMLFSFKEFSFAYSDNNSMLLPGFTPTPDLLGNRWSDRAPGLGFIFGDQSDIRSNAVAYNWLSKDTLLNNPYQTRHNKTLTMKGRLEPIRNFIIDISADRSESSNHSEFFKAGSDGLFHTSSPQDNGNFSTTFLMIKTAFKTEDNNHISSTFNQFKKYRLQVAERLAKANPNWPGTYDQSGFPTGYGATSQEVLIPAFVAAYSGKNPDKVSLNAFPSIPMPNWRITYTGLSEMDFIKDIFQSITLSHSYQSSYSIGSYLSNLNYQETNGFPSLIENGNFISDKRIDGINLIEQFSPLLNIDMTWKNSLTSHLEFKRMRNLTLSFANNQLTEITLNEFLIGMGYKLKNMRFITVSETGRNAKVKSDLNIKVDLSIKDDKTVLRRIDQDINQISAGKRLISINISTDYQLSQRMNMRLFFDKTINEPYITTLSSTTSAGVSLTYMLSQ
ncbi:MAG: cell surface protein SprA [Bacteroidetes bacterium]|nr:cell surface protein SprA [Bacteroidota bacterium]